MASPKQYMRSYARALSDKSERDKALLEGLPTSDDHGASIKHNIEVINKNKEVIESQKSSSKPNAKVIARATNNIATCKVTIRQHLVQLSAKPEGTDAKIDAEINAVMDAIDAGDIQSVTLKVLEIMVRRNPGLHGRKYKEALAQVAAQQQTVAQPQH